MGERITKLLEDIVPRDRDAFIWDTEVKGFGVRVKPSGRKTFIAEDRVGSGRTGASRRLTIGTFGGLTVDQARALARKALGAVANGEDPAGDKQAKRREITLGEIIDVYMAEGTDHIKDRNRRYTYARLKHRALPFLGRKKISEVRVADVEQFMREVKAGKAAKSEKGEKKRARFIVRGGASAALKGVRDLSAVFTFAVCRELASTNPCSAVKKPADGKRMRFLSLDEVRRLGAALDTFEAEGMPSKAIAIMRLWVLTGCRRDEIAGLKWSEVDFDRACLRLDNTKTGRSIRPLAGAAIALESARRSSG